MRGGRRAICLGIGFASLAASAGAAVPAGFVDVTLPPTFTLPTAFAFTPDGRMLITTKDGTVFLLRDDEVVTAALVIPAGQICTGSDAGVLGLAIDPEFTATGHFFLAYAFRRPDQVCVNRVARFTLLGAVAEMDSQVVLLDNMPGPGNIHDAGMLDFGPDGYLYSSIGDGGRDYAGDGVQGLNDAARDLNALTGKILRIAKDGAVPPDNPFQGPGTARCHETGRTAVGTICQEIVATGLRNPFRFAIDPNAAPDLRLFINDVGWFNWEEIDRFELGADYGWNCFEGNHANSTTGLCNPTPPGLVAPIFEYHHNDAIPGTTATGCGSITGAAFVPNGLWPEFDGAYLFSDSNCGEIVRLTEGEDGVFRSSDFGTGLPAGTVHLRFGPSPNGQALYYLNVYDGTLHRIYRLLQSENNPPSAALVVTPTSGLAPLTVSFDASASSDPDEGDALEYVWEFGDGSPSIATTSPLTGHTYAAGLYRMTLRVRDRALLYAPAISRWIDAGNRPPSATITSPAVDAQFSVGETILLAGSAVDPDDGPLPPSALSWRVIRRHEAHTHPFLGPLAGNDLSFVAPGPEDIYAAPTSALIVQLTATDSWGLTAVVERDLLPRQVDVGLAAEPPGLRLAVDGALIDAPTTLVSWQGYTFNVAASDQSVGDELFTWRRWSDGGPRSHSVLTGASPLQLVARYAPFGDSGPLALFVVLPCRLIDTRAAEAPALVPGVVRRFVAAGRCEVPAAAEALAANVTVVSSGASGHVQLVAAGQEAPETSGLNFAAGQVRANLQVLGLAEGAFDVRLVAAEGTADVIVDVSGYFIAVD